MPEKREKPDADRIAEEAAGWVARLQSSDATPADAELFQEWLERDDRHRAAFDEFCNLWGDLKDLPIPADRLNKLRGARRRRTVIRTTAVALILLISGSLYNAGYMDRLRADYYTAVGEVRTIDLADGSRVYLNTDTAIAVDLTESQRRIHILRGEAFFDVAKDPQRPFIVDDATLSATAVGTQYAVRAGTLSLRPDVQVEEGKVEVQTADQRVLVSAGYAAVIGDGGTVIVQRADVADATAWRNGRLIFSGRPLKEVLAVLARYRHGQIVMLDRALGEQKVSGIFDLNDTDAALRDIEMSLPVSVTHLTGLLVVVGRRTP